MSLISRLAKIFQGLRCRPHLGKNDLRYTKPRKARAQATLKKPRIEHEKPVHIQAVSWFHRVYPQYYNLFYHVPSGEYRAKKTANELEAMGVKRGIPDLILDVTSCIDGVCYAGLRVEVKPDKRTVKRYPSHAQKLVIAQMNHQGFYATVCYGIDEIKQTIEWYLGGKLKPPYSP